MEAIKVGRHSIIIGHQLTCVAALVDADWIAAREVKTVESKEEYPKGWRPATLYRLRVNPKRVCLYFGGEEYEGTVMFRIRTDQKQVHFLQQRIILFVSQV